MPLVRRHEALELFAPVLHHDETAARLFLRGLTGRIEHQKALTVMSDIVKGAGSPTLVKCILPRENRFRSPHPQRRLCRDGDCHHTVTVETSIEQLPVSSPNRLPPTPY